MELTKGSRGSSDDAKNDIQVVTDIEVQVEDRHGNATGWRTPTGTGEWEGASVPNTRSSTDTLVKEVA